MKLPEVLKNLLTNKTVLNVLTIIASLNVLGYLIIGNLTAVMFFIVLAILTKYFSENMIIVLGVPIILVNMYVAKFQSNIEGMTTDKDTATPDKDDTKMETNSTDKDKKPETKQPKGPTKNKGGLPTTPVNPDNNETEEESFEVGRAKKRGGGYDIDYASTIEDAYDQLNNILGSDGIKKLTNDSQQLMKQQMQLADSMKSIEPMIQGMAPLMNQANDLLSKLGNNNLTGIMDKLTGGSAKK